MKYGDAIELKILAANQIFSFAERAKTRDFNNLIRVTYEELLRDNLTLYVSTVQLNCCLDEKQLFHVYNCVKTLIQLQTLFSYWICAI